MCLSLLCTSYWRAADCGRSSVTQTRPRSLSTLAPPTPRHGTPPRHGTRTIGGPARFFDPARPSRPRRRMSGARTARAHFERNSAQTTKLAGFEGSEGCFRVLAVEVRRGLSRILLTEKLRSFLQEKWRRGSRCRERAFHGHNSGDCWAAQHSPGFRFLSHELRYFI